MYSEAYKVYKMQIYTPNSNFKYLSMPTLKTLFPKKLKDSKLI
jgi:hypothetical protein